jgi:hypothetical protein
MFFLTGHKAKYFLHVVEIVSLGRTIRHIVHRLWSRRRRQNISPRPIAGATNVSASQHCWSERMRRIGDVDHARTTLWARRRRCATYLLGYHCHCGGSEKLHACLVQCSPYESGGPKRVTAIKCDVQRLRQGDGIWNFNARTAIRQIAHYAVEDRRCAKNDFRTFEHGRADAFSSFLHGQLHWI